MQRTYTATLSQSQGREGWSVIFRHPVLKDRASGKAGRRVRRGLGTREKNEAERLIEQLNRILQEPSHWEISAKARADLQFDPRVVEIFYDELVPELTDFFASRESVVPLPAADSAYRRVLLVGTTGSGKTTLARQLLGTDPETERFPSTSTGKTTVADMEFILADGPFRAVVTFMPRDQVRDLIEECMSASALAAYLGAGDSEQLRLLTNHVSQRFRLSYILGRGPLVQLEEEDEYGGEEDDIFPETSPAIDLSATNQLLTAAISQLRRIASSHAEGLWKELDAKPGDERVVEEIFEENLDNLLRNDDEFQALADSLMDEIEQRFGMVTNGEFRKTKQSWPWMWTWETNDRAEFIRTVGRFSSNHAKYFGTLLTPLVNGIRVAGPFKPIWSGSKPKLVLLDGEGLGHTPDSTASIPTFLSRRFDDVDVVLLVDNAAQPMQAAPVQLMRSLASSGKTSKLITCFTHMDIVRGDNLPTFQLRKQHVLASAENVLTSIGEQLGRFAERALRQSLQRACFFVGGIDEELDHGKGAARRSVDELLNLLTAIDVAREVPAFVGSIPTYDRVNLVLAVKDAAEKFQEDWLVRLGYSVRPGASKEHWTRVKALTRRLAEGWGDEYGTLRPVADLFRSLQDNIYVFIQNPIKWEGPEPQDEEKQAVFDGFAQAISEKALDLATRRLREDRVSQWLEAYTLRGAGSTYQRAAIIKDEIYERAAPIPDSAPSPDRNQFLHEVIAIVDEAAKRASVKLL
jgi:energy-coupling factor transporter ATP-binding protein EcfA2